MKINQLNRIQLVKKASVLKILKNLNALALLISQQENEYSQEESYMLLDENINSLIEIHSGDLSLRGLEKTLRRTKYIYHEIVDEIRFTRENQINTQKLENAALD